MIILIATIVQYMDLNGIMDSCGKGIVVGIIYGYYGIVYYIYLARIISLKKALFLRIGYESNPGLDAQYRLNGEPIYNNQGKIYIPNQQLSNPSTAQIQ